jgi:hypothetical protein
MFVWARVPRAQDADLLTRCPSARRTEEIAEGLLRLRAAWA